MSTSDNVVRNVRGLMGETGVTQAQMGQWLGLSQAAVAKRISTRAVVFNVDELEIIAQRFGVTVQSLFDPPRVLVGTSSPFAAPAATGTQRSQADSHVTPEYARDWSGSLSNGAEPSFTDADWAEITAYMTGVLA